MTAFSYLATAVVALSVTTNVAHAAAVEPWSFDSLRDLRPGERRTLTDVDLGSGRRADLALTRFEVLAPGATILAGDRPFAPDVVLLRGRALDDPSSQVFLGVSRYGAHGFIRGEQPALSLSTGPWRPDVAPVLQAVAPVSLGDNGDDPRPCLADASYVVTPVPSPAFAAGEPPCRAIELAVDTDYEFTANLFGGDPEAAAAYAITLFAADSEIYRDQLNTQFVISYLRVWPSNDDPYAGTDIGTTLDDFRSHWLAEQGDVERDLAHILSGGDGGGVAWVGVVCNEAYGYGASNVNGYFPYPLQSNHGGNWDLVVTCHELGHNCGTLHTHDFDPPIDNCAGGECEDADSGTVMSYCHTCPGGIANIALAFHPLVRDTMLAYFEGTCDLTTAESPVAVDDAANVVMNGLVEIDVLNNDIAVSCAGAGDVIVAFDQTSRQGGQLALVPGAGPDGRDLLAYETPADFGGSDSFAYQLTGGSSATVTVFVQSLRTPDGPGPSAGVAVDYYDLPSGVSALPDFNTLAPFATDVVADIDFTSTGGNFATSGQASYIGAVFTGYILVPEGGLYTIYTDSDDGSRLYVGDELIVDNDGLHGMVEVGGEIALGAGGHRVRVEFFEAAGGAGLIVSYEGPGVAKQAVPAAGWSHGTLCPGDIDDDGVVTFDDLLVMLSNWGPCGDPCPGDLDGDGVVGFGDLLTVLASFGPCS